MRNQGIFVPGEVGGLVSGLLGMAMKCPGEEGQWPQYIGKLDGQLAQHRQVYHLLLKTDGLNYLF